MQLISNCPRPCIIHGGKHGPHVCFCCCFFQSVPVLHDSLLYPLGLLGTKESKLLDLFVAVVV